MTAPGIAAPAAPLRIAITADPEIPVPPRLYGGIERIIAMLVDGLSARGNDVTLFAHPGSSVRCRLVRYTGSSSGSLRVTLAHMRMVLAESRRTSFDVIHSFGRLAYLLPLLPSRIPKLMTYQRRISPRSVRWGLRLSRGTLAFSAISRSMVAEVADLAPWRIVPNGVPAALYKFRGAVAPDAPLVFLGRLEQIKGPHLAIEAARRAGRRLLLAGNLSEGAEHRKYFEQQVAPHLDGERVRYVGAVDDGQKDALLGGAAALLMPVLWEEPFGIVMVEALACGTPVIGLRRGAVPEVVQHGVTGYVCDSVEEMALAIGRLAELERARCRQAVDSRFSDTVIVDEYLGIYRRLLAGRSAAAG
jgi:glycosyltransferase involved in cell wall biosynthesis